MIRKEVDQLAGGNWRSGLKHRYQVNCRRACALGHICPNTWYRDALRMRIREIAQVRPRFGDVRIWILLRREAGDTTRSASTAGTASRGYGRDATEEATRPAPAARCRRRAGDISTGAWTLSTINSASHPSRMPSR